MVGDGIADFRTDENNSFSSDGKSIILKRIVFVCFDHFSFRIYARRTIQHKFRFYEKANSKNVCPLWPMDRFLDVRRIREY